MDIQKSFTFVFDDDDWQHKAAIGAGLALVSMFIVPMFMLIGYSIAVARNVRDGRKMPLPEWDYGNMMREGFMVSVAAFVYMLPAFLFMMFGLMLGGGISGLGGNSDAAATVGGGLIVLISCVSMLYMLAFMILAPAIYIQYIRHGDLGACLQFKEVIGIARSQLGNIVISVVVIGAASIAFSTVATVLNIVPCLGQLAFLFLSLLYVPYQQMVTGHLYGQIAADLDGKKTNFDKFDNLDFG